MWSWFNMRGITTKKIMLTFPILGGFLHPSPQVHGSNLTYFSWINFHSLGSSLYTWTWSNSMVLYWIHIYGYRKRERACNFIFHVSFADIFYTFLTFDFTIDMLEPRVSGQPFVDISIIYILFVLCQYQTPKCHLG